MSMNKLMKGVEKLINQEYAISSKQHEKRFNSYHEAYGVIKEEVEETQSELLWLYESLDSFWSGVKKDAVEVNDLKRIADHAHLAACEMIQVATMAYKATLGLKGGKE